MANTRFATLADDGALRTFVEYGQPHTASVPPGTVALSDEQWERWTADPTGYAWRSGGLFAINAEPPPAPAYEVPKLLVVTRIGNAGLLRDARAALKLGRPDADLTDAELLLRDRWDAAVSIRSDDAEVRGLLAAIGADPDAILAPAA